MRVYIAGPYSSAPIENTKRAMEAASLLLDMGHEPLCPHLWHFLQIKSPKAYETWMRWDLEWLRQCEAMVRLPGNSPGADMEEKEARRLGLPVFDSVAKFQLWQDRPVSAEGLPDQIRVCVFNHDQNLVAQCLEYDIATQAATMQALKLSIFTTFMAYFQIAHESGEAPFAGLPRAPLKYWRAWARGAEETEFHILIPSGATDFLKCPRLLLREVESPAVTRKNG